MQKETNKFADSTVFEGMVSIRALLEAQNRAISDRRIERILYTEKHAKKNPKEIAFLRHEAERKGFSLESVTDEVIEEMTLGTSHGGIIATASQRRTPHLTEETALEDGGFYVMIEGIEDP